MSVVPAAPGARLDGRAAEEEGTVSTLHVLRERDHHVYVVSLDTDREQPIVRRRWYPTGINVQTACSNLGCPIDGIVVSPLGNGIYVLPSEHGRIQLGLKHGGSTINETIDQIEVPPPKTRLKGEIFWRHGEWWIARKYGWKRKDEILKQIDLSEYGAM
jgi:hypothetical protein